MFSTKVALRAEIPAHKVRVHMYMYLGGDWEHVPPEKIMILSTLRSFLVYFHW